MPASEKPRPVQEDEPLVTAIDFKVMTSVLAADRDLEKVNATLDAIEKKNG